MRIPVVGFDPSMTAWGIARGQLDLTTGYLEDLTVQVLEPVKIETKQVRQNSQDLAVARQLAEQAFKEVASAKAVFVEVPVGSQNARSMCSYGMCVGILGALLAKDVQLIEVTAFEVKIALAGKKHATKREMIDAAVSLYPDVEFPMKGTRIVDKAEHAADAIGAIHAGVLTPMFQNLLKLLKP